MREAPKWYLDFTYSSIHFKTHTIVLLISVWYLTGIIYDDPIIPGSILLSAIAFLTSSILQSELRRYFDTNPLGVRNLSSWLSSNSIGPNNPQKIEHIIDTSLDGAAGLVPFGVLLVINEFIGPTALFLTCLVTLVISGIVAYNIGDNTHTLTTRIYFDMFIMGVGASSGLIFALGLLSEASFPAQELGDITVVIFTIGAVFIVALNRAAARYRFKGDRTLWHLSVGLSLFWGPFSLSVIVVYLTPIINSVLRNVSSI